jgi:ComF family protein
MAAGECCADCLKSPPPLTHSEIPFGYQAPLDQLIMAFKFGRQLHMAPLLAGLMQEARGYVADSKPDCLLPVPLHPRRLRERGFNQALELARHLSSHSGIPIAANLALRQRHTATQSLLKGPARRRNMRDAFVINGTPPPHVMLVDDVVTTGSTVNELARCLLGAGARRVDVWACARA